MSVAHSNYVDQHEAADICGCSYDTIRRRRKTGGLPNARQRPGDPNKTWEIPVTDLLAAGLLKVGDDVEPAGEARSQVGSVRLTRELAVARAELVEVRRHADAQADEIRFLRELLRKQVP